MLGSVSNLETVQLIFGIILIVSVKTLVVYFLYNKFFKRSKLTTEELRFDKIRSVYNDLKKNKTPNEKRITKLANDTETRVLIFEVLTLFNKIELFPIALLSRKKSSESYLSNWLYHHEDYDVFPDIIHYLENSVFNNNLMIFKFKSNEHHELAAKGWIYGYVVYNPANNKPYAKPDLIMSDFDSTILTNEELKKLGK